MKISEIQQQLKAQATEKAKKSTLRFVPDAKKIYGNTMPQLNDLAKELAKKTSEVQDGFILMNNLWKAGAFEEKILAAKLLNKFCKKQPLTAIEFVEKFSSDIDNWALCDSIGMQSLKPINLKFQKEIFALSKRLSASENFWQRRLSLVLLEDFCKQKELHDEIKKRIALRKNDPEYYMKKAVLWLEASLNKKRN